MKTENKQQDDFDEKLARLLDMYRTEILRQYEILDTKVTLLSVLRYATWLDIPLIVFGTLLSIGAPLVLSKRLEGHCQ